MENIPIVFSKKFFGRVQYDQAMILSLSSSLLKIGREGRGHTYDSCTEGTYLFDDYTIYTQ